jgi:HPr kinase/phosphorylase
MSRASVQELLAAQSYRLELQTLAGGAHLERVITDLQVHKLGLALAGIKPQIAPGQIQLLGGTEIAYLKTLSTEQCQDILQRLAQYEMPCLIVTRGLTPPPGLAACLAERQIPLLGTTLATSEFIQRLNRFLDDNLSPRISLHGVLMDVLGIGILILGQAGIGKSETALDLVLRGHRLVADDIVDIHRHGETTLIGAGSEVIKYHMEIRGLGIINIKDLFGIAAIRDHKKIELVIELVLWDDAREYDRLGLDEETYTLLGVEVPHLTVPVRPGKVLATIVEVAARNQLLKLKGHFSAREFQRRLMEELEAGAGPEMPAEGAEEIE